MSSVAHRMDLYNKLVLCICVLSFCRNGEISQALIFISPTQIIDRFSTFFPLFFSGAFLSVYFLDSLSISA